MTDKIKLFTSSFRICTKESKFQTRFNIRYKKNMKNAKDKSDFNKWNNNQLAVKRLMASFYGIIAYQGFGWADVDLAASITASAREAIREAAFKVRQLS